MHAPATDAAPDASSEARDLDIAIIGAGFSGIGLGVNLLQSGRRNFRIFEQNADVGGTWWSNTYPGCGCDIPSLLYSYSFAPNPDWSRAYSPQGEILDYMKGVVADAGLTGHIQLNTEVRAARWDAETERWTLVGADGATLARARFLFSAFGFLSKPDKSAIAGQETFKGAIFHTAEWPNDADLSGKRVAVIGTGASAIQVVPQVAPQATHLDLYQRTAPWVVPRRDHVYPAVLRRLFAAAPWFQRLWRGAIYWRLEANAHAFLNDTRMLNRAERIARQHIAAHINDPALRDIVTPRFRLGCKRVLISDDYYPALARDDVTVIPQAAERLTETGVVDAEGVERPADAVVLATGFRATDPLSPLDFFGRDARSLHETWKQTPQAYLGLAAAGFPNLFFLIGPNTGLGHNSMIYMLESQLNFVMDALDRLEAENVRTVEVKPDAQAAFNDEIRAKFAGSVWESGCVSWYQSADGTNPTLWPSYTFDYRKRTRRMNVDDFEFTA